MYHVAADPSVSAYLVAALAAGAQPAAALAVAAAASAPPLMPPGYLQIAGGYYMIESGSCGDGGLILSKSKCDAAAKALDLADETPGPTPGADDKSWYTNSYYPPGCQLSLLDGRTLWVFGEGSSGACSSSSWCICMTPPGAAVDSPLTAAGVAADPTPADTTKITGDTMNQVSVQVEAAGDVSDYDATKKAAVEAAMAKVAGVDANAVTVTVTAGSVVLDFVIITAEPAAAAAVKATVTTALATTAGASTALGVTVEAVPTVVVRLAPPSPPPNERPSPLPHLVATLAYNCKPFPRRSVPVHRA